MTLPRWQDEKTDSPTGRAANEWGHCGAGRTGLLRGHCTQSHGPRGSPSSNFVPKASTCGVGAGQWAVLRVGRAGACVTPNNAVNLGT